MEDSNFVFNDVYKPYLVLYRYKELDGSNHLFFEEFDSICSAYSFIGNNVELWKWYRFCKILELVHN